MKLSEVFIRAADDPYGYIEDVKMRTGKKVIGSFCSYVPEEIITAAGAIPFRIFSKKENVELADRYLQSYACSMVRGSLEEALAGRLKFLDGTVFPHTCDSIQRLSDIWRINSGIPLHLDIVMPVKLNTETSRKYMKDVISRFRKDLSEGLGVDITDEKIREAVKVQNSIRENLLFLYNTRKNSPDILKGEDLYKIVRASMVMDRLEFEKEIFEFNSKLGGSEKKSDEVKVYLSGNICSHPEIYSIVKESGGDIIWDDMCTGTRYFRETAAEIGDPVAAISERFIKRIVCPAKHISTTARAENLVAEVKESGARGVIFLLLKFCDPHSFDYPYLRESLDKAGIPSLLIEVEEQIPPEGQLRTRIETFISTLEERETAVIDTGGSI